MAGEEHSAEPGPLAIDAEALGRYLRGRLEGVGPDLSVRKFPGGQSNPTYELASGDRRWVLRKKPPGELLPSAHMIEREYRVMTALKGSGVPVPETHLFCDDRSVLGTEFFVMQRVEGRIFWSPELPEVASPSERRALYQEMNRVLGALHGVDLQARGLSDYGKPGSYFARQIKRWTQQYELAKTGELPSMDRLIAWLPANIPDGDDAALVHGDYRLDNMIFHPSEPRVLAVLDWELSTLGHPLADLAYNCMQYHSPMRGTRPLTEVAGPQSGIPTEQEYVAWYCERSGRDRIPAWPFYLAFSFFRYASIVQGVYHRGLRGNASSATEANTMRARAIDAADTGYRLVQIAAR